MKRRFDPVLRLFRLARESGAAGAGPVVSPGFATRVLAHLDKAPPESPWRRLAFASVPVAAAAAVTAFLLPPVMPVQNLEPEEDLLAQKLIQSLLVP